MTTAATPNASVARRIGASAYDLMVVCALWMLVYFPLIASGRVAASIDDSFAVPHLVLRAVIAFAYFGWCWTHGGRTLGLLAWKLVVVRDDGAIITWRDAAARFGVALIYFAPLAVIETAANRTMIRAPGAIAYSLALVAPFIVGTLCALRPGDHKTLHEYALKTRVVSAAR